MYVLYSVKGKYKLYVLYSVKGKYKCMFYIVKKVNTNVCFIQ